jgi:FkbH-like protein
VIQQTLMPVFPPLLGSNEHRLPGSRAQLTARLNSLLREAADPVGIDLLALDTSVAQDGLQAWHDRVLWHRAKQEVSPVAAPIYGELLARILAARQGRSAKCLVLDLDNTLWGGVIGDDGLEGIVLGQGSALGEAFIDLQLYAREQARRGIILAVVSKNDDANARAAFEQHPEMVLRLPDIACFIANWDDKATNIRKVAHQLNIGLDSLVFVDDNPFERNLVRQELPIVAVPEVPEDPALIPACLAAAGYFEGVAVTDEDRERTKLYQENLARDAFQAEATDLPSYLRGLQMELVWRRFDKIGFQRTVQLINKTNQFNLTTRRYSEADVQAVMDDGRAFGLQLRLLDRFGDNGIIAIVIGRAQDNGDLLIDTWLMSCRVLGRQVEEATLTLVAQEARRLGAKRLIGEYRPTAKNGMVKQHYAKLGFTLLEEEPSGATRSALDLEGWTAPDIFIAIREG